MSANTLRLVVEATDKTEALLTILEQLRVALAEATVAVSTAEVSAEADQATDMLAAARALKASVRQMSVLLQGPLVPAAS